MADVTNVHGCDSLSEFHCKTACLTTRTAGTDARAGFPGFKPGLATPGRYPPSLGLGLLLCTMGIIPTAGRMAGPHEFM